MNGAISRSIAIALLLVAAVFGQGCRREQESRSAPDHGAHGMGGAVPPSSEGAPESEPLDHTHDEDISYYTCAMHPSIRSEVPGACPICSMELLPVTRAEARTEEVVLDAARRQAIGVRTAPVETRNVDIEIRAVGKVVVDESRVTVVTVKYRGFIGELFADTTGTLVRKGEPLFTLYSPDLYSAQEELLTAVDSQLAARKTSAPDRADYMVEAARKRLELWDLGPQQIEDVIAKGEPQQYLPILAPSGGYVIEKHVVEGQSVEPGEDLFHLAALDRVWVEAEVYESELPLIALGQPATVTLSYLPGKTFQGRVAFIYPYLEGTSRSGRVRIELPNSALELKPEMFANVSLGTARGERVVVPEEAVLYAGPRRLVFVDLGGGRLSPREIEIGVKSGDYYEVLSGLEPGDVVVTSGNFLVAAESRLKSATKQW